MLLVWQVVTTFLLLWGCLRIARLCFADTPAAWCSVSLIAGLLSLPVAGTALLLMDPYLTTRSFSAPLAILAIACVLESRLISAVFWILLTAALHPLMAVFAAAYVACLLFLRARQQPAVTAAVLLFGFPQSMHRFNVYSLHAVQGYPP